MNGKTYSETELEDHVLILERALELIEGRLSKTRFISGDEVSIADLSAACELDQARFIELDLNPYPQTKLWLNKMIDEDPTMLEIHETIRKFAALSVEKRRAAET